MIRCEGGLVESVGGDEITLLPFQSAAGEMSQVPVDVEQVEQPVPGAVDEGPGSEAEQGDVQAQGGAGSESPVGARRFTRQIKPPADEYAKFMPDRRVEVGARQERVNFLAVDDDQPKVHAGDGRPRTRRMAFGD